jgi:hypothetical protein
MDDDRLWKIVGAVAAIGATVAFKPVIERVWARARGSAPPGNPADPDTAWREAITWSLVSGAVIGVARLFAQRGAAEVWRRRRGDYPSALRHTRP